MRRILSVGIAGLLASLICYADDIPRVIVSLKDGSRIVGRPVAVALSIDGQLGRMDVPLVQIDTLEFTEKTPDARLLFANGDQLQVRVLAKDFEIDTSFGRCKIPFEHIVSVQAAVHAATMLDANIPVAAKTESCPAVIDSTLETADIIDDLTEHTFVENGVAVGQFAECAITRKFSRPIHQARVSLIAGEPDDIGYVGNLLIRETDIANQCGQGGRVTKPVDVSGQVKIEGHTATLTLRAQENCCCETGWGSATGYDRKNALLRWHVQLEPAGKP